jgi:hypothetical protein
MYSLDPGDAEAAFSAAMDASDQYQSHNQELIAGLGSPGGDPLEADSDWQPEIGEQGSVT